MMDGDGWLSLIFWCSLGALVWFTWLGDSKFRYEWEYDAEVIIDDKPHDCEFLSSPLARISHHPSAAALLCRTLPDFHPVRAPNIV